MLPFAIVTVFVADDNPVPVHPANVYPAFVGLFNVIVFVSTVYVVGFVVLTDPPFNSYDIEYWIAALVAVEVTVVFAAGIVTVVDDSEVPAKIDVSVVVHAKFEYSYPVTFAY